MKNLKEIVKELEMKYDSNYKEIAMRREANKKRRKETEIKDERYFYFITLNKNRIERLYEENDKILKMLCIYYNTL